MAKAAAIRLAEPPLITTRPVSMRCAMIATASSSERAVSCTVAISSKMVNRVVSSPAQSIVNRTHTNSMIVRNGNGTLQRTMPIIRPSRRTAYARQCGSQISFTIDRPFPSPHVARADAVPRGVGSRSFRLRILLRLRLPVWWAILSQTADQIVRFASGPPCPGRTVTAPAAE